MPLKVGLYDKKIIYCKQLPYVGRWVAVFHGRHFSPGFGLKVAYVYTAIVLDMEMFFQLID